MADHSGADSLEIKAINKDEVTELTRLLIWQERKWLIGGNFNFTNFIHGECIR